MTPRKRKARGLPNPLFRVGRTGFLVCRACRAFAPAVVKRGGRVEAINHFRHKETCPGRADRCYGTGPFPSSVPMAFAETPEGSQWIVKTARKIDDVLAEIERAAPEAKRGGSASVVVDVTEADAIPLRGGVKRYGAAPVDARFRLASLWDHESKRLARYFLEARP